MSLVVRIFAPTCLAVLMIVNSTYSEEMFLTWHYKNITENRTTDYYFTRNSFKEFYSCLCNQRSIVCSAFIFSNNSLTSTASSQTTGKPLSNITRYVCNLESKMDSFICTKEKSTNSSICNSVQHCLRYCIDTHGWTMSCSLPFVEISPTPDVTLTSSYSGNDIQAVPCAVGCSVKQQQCPKRGPSTSSILSLVTSSSLSSSELTSSSPPSTSRSSSPSPSSSGLTKEQSIIIGLAVGLVILTVALIILGVIVWRRRKKSRDPFLSNNITTRTLTNRANNGTVNYGGDSATANAIIHPYSTSTTSTVTEMGTKDTKNQYETIDLDPDSDPELGVLTKSSIKSKNGSSITSSDSKKRALPAGLESPYSEPQTTHVTGPYSTVDLDDAVGKVTITSDKPENGSSPKLPEPRSKDTPSPSENPYSEPETKNLTDPYTGINPNTKSQKKKNTVDLQNMEEAEHDVPNPASKGTGGAGGNVSALSSQDDQTASGDEKDANKFLPDDESANAYSKLHETQRYFQNPYNILSDPLTDAPDQPPANLPSSNVDITPETSTSTPAMGLPVPNDVISDNDDKAIEDDDINNEPNQSENDIHQNHKDKNPDVAMHDSDNVEIKVQTDKGTVEYPGPAENKTSATSPTETGTAKKNEYFQLESDTESSTEEEERD